MKQLWILAALALLLPALAPAQQRTVVCDDGRVVLLTPFNTTNPCANPVVIDPAKDVPDEFLLVFGPPPLPTGRSLADRIARINYQQDLKVFRGLVDAPMEYFQKPKYQPTAAMTIAEYYASWGLGDPVFYKNVYGTYVRWTNALYQPHAAPVQVALLGPGMVIAQWQTGAIEAGACVFDLQAFVPGSSRQKNTANCGGGAAAMFAHEE